ncbi:MAG: bifunctional riboflavin kinase/FAD synthetase [Bacteroidales bacterium]|nr:bifunctional riboflavin kinase/FAD synthetase [Bacteroidales bacterium]
MNIIPFDKTINLGYSPVMSVGMFDGVHIGHQKLLSILKEKAKKYNTVPIVITFDKHPQLVMKPELFDKIRLLQTNEERFGKLNSLGIENIITIHFTKEFAKLSAQEFLDLLLKKYSPQYFLLGYDNHFGNKSSDEFNKLVLENKKKGLILERSSDCVIYKDIEVSSTQIRKALAKGDIGLANSMLNEEYIISGEVVHGNKIGKTIGCPTANIKVERHKLLPLFGVYLCKVDINEKEYSGIVNIGWRPTIIDSPITIEVHILEFDKDIYGENIKIKLKEFLRQEIKFENLEQLKEQISLDIEKAHQYFRENE